MDNNFHIGWCPFCNQGWIDIMKDVSENELLLLCAECDTIWKCPQDIQLNKPLLNKKISKINEPTLTEIKNKGWSEWIISGAGT